MDDNNEKMDDLAARIKKASGGSAPAPDSDLNVASSSRIGFDFAGSVIGSGLIGALLDHSLNTSPWCLLGMVILGFAIGTWNAWRSMQKSDAADKK